MTEDRITKDLRRGRERSARKPRGFVRIFGAIASASSLLVSAYMLGGAGTLAWGFVSAAGPDVCQADSEACRQVVAQVASDYGVEAATWPLYWGPEMMAKFGTAPHVVVEAEVVPEYSPGVAPF